MIECNSRNLRSTKLTFVVAAISIALVSCGGGGGEESGSSPALAECTQPSIERVFQADLHTKVLQVKKVNAGEAYPNATLEELGSPPGSPQLRYKADLCQVKLLVGPGIPGPDDAPSTSPGIGIEIWLPEKAVWNGRFHAIGGSGWGVGGGEADVDAISMWSAAEGGLAAPTIAGADGSVTASTDSGYSSGRSGSFLMMPDGSINRAGWKIWSYTAMREQSVKTKAVIKAYYGVAPKHSYFDGSSGGGRQALHIAQNLPEEYDGILAIVPALNWRHLMGSAYGGLVQYRDLGGKALTKEQLDLVSNAAISQCDMVNGQHLGFILDQRSCRYDPLKDANVLCDTDGGGNTSSACVSKAEALAINKMWYGVTIDGSVPDPAIDNGWGTPLSGVRKSFGVPRGTDLSLVASLSGYDLGTDLIALVAGNPKLAGPSFINATGHGEDGWRALSYEQFAALFDRAAELEAELNMSADKPDLSAFKARGGKLIQSANVNDPMVYAAGLLNYYERVLGAMGGVESVSSFYRSYFAPGLQHSPTNGTSNPEANPPTMKRAGHLFAYLTAWVEQGVAPDNIVFSSVYGDPSKPEKSLPVCAYPANPRYVSGDIFMASSYICQ